MSRRESALARREREALLLLSAAMFAEASELSASSDLRLRLRRYSETLARPSQATEEPEQPYEICASEDGPPLRRLATLMDAKAALLGQASPVGRALSGWASRIVAAVAEAEAEQRHLEGPGDELVALAAALARPGGGGLHEMVEAASRGGKTAAGAAARSGGAGESGPAETPSGSEPEAATPAPPPEAPSGARKRIPRVGRIWSRRDDGRERPR